MTDEQKKEFSSMKETLKHQAEVIQALEHRERVLKFQRQAEGWTALALKPEEVAKEMADIEEKSGVEIAQKVATQYQAANDARVATGILVPIGTAKSGKGTPDPFEAKVHEYAKAKGITFQKALVLVSDEDKQGFQEYKARSRDGG